MRLVVENFDGGWPEYGRGAGLLARTSCGAVCEIYAKGWRAFMAVLAVSAPGIHEKRIRATGDEERWRGEGCVLRVRVVGQILVGAAFFNCRLQEAIVAVRCALPRRLETAAPWASMTGLTLFPQERLSWR